MNKFVNMEISDTDTGSDIVVPKKIGFIKPYYDDNPEIIEIGVDEAGRGPLFGRVYTSAVILPKNTDFDYTKMKDSKRFHSKKKINQVAEYIRENAIAWSVTYADEKLIDNINILQATQQSMHNSIMCVISEQNLVNKINSVNLLIDGNYFNQLKIENKIVSYRTIEGGDNKYASIAAASILAKVERDKYIETLCELNPDLSEKYGIDSNKGYGAKKHLDGIKEHGITIWHRRSFGICKNYL